ncbi:MAG: TIGR04211 family SH3 domain-containing protein [Thiohalomonadaceae bacterium]
MFRTAMFAMLAALVVLPALAETAYVDDTLRVGVRRNANSSETPLTVVTSGARLEVLERGERYWRVRTDDGVEGWVAASYVTTHPPARAQLEELQAENARLKAELQARAADENLAADFAALQQQYQQ